MPGRPELGPAPALGRDFVSDGVTAYLRDQIMSGRLAAGDPLRVEHIAEHLDVSVTPVRESLLVLGHEGFVVREARRGYVVDALSRTDIVDVFAALGLLAGELAARAAGAIAAPELRELDALQAELVALNRGGEHAAMEDVNHRLHRRINQIAGAPKLTGFVHQAARYAPRWTWSAIPGWPAESLRHRAILRALRAGDAETARAAMSEHMRRSGELLAEHLAAAGLWS
jgi:DNA-binding GntR family transcriptional regulator